YVVAALPIGSGPTGLVVRADPCEAKPQGDSATTRSCSSQSSVYVNAGSGLHVFVDQFGGRRKFPDLFIRDTGETDGGAPPGAIRKTLVIGNQGPGKATGVVVAVKGGFDYVGSVTSSSMTCGERLFGFQVYSICSIDHLDKGDEATITVDILRKG